MLNHLREHHPLQPACHELQIGEFEKMHHLQITNLNRDLQSDSMQCHISLGLRCRQNNDTASISAQGQILHSEDKSSRRVDDTKREHAMDLGLNAKPGRNDPHPCMTTTDVFMTMIVIMALRRGIANGFATYQPAKPTYQQAE